MSPLKHMAEHIYIFAGESVQVKFRIANYIVGEIMDWFGQNVKFSNDTDDTVDVRVNVNKKAFGYWALQHGEYIEVLEPVRLREKEKNATNEIASKYKGEE